MQRKKFDRPGVTTGAAPKKMLALLLALSFLLGGCAGSPPDEPVGTDDAGESALTVSGLVPTGSMEVRYAECFSCEYYEGGYTALHMDDGRDYLIVPEGAPVPTDAAESCTVLQQPLENIYLVATAAMSLFDALEGMDRLRFSGTKQESWYVEAAAEAMEAGEILYAGKHSAPDYELLLSEDCGLAVESTMIYHAPEVQEKLEELGIPVLIDRSSYEPHPLGRTEWIKVYGALLGCPELAEELFDEQSAFVESLAGLPSTEKTVAFFYISSTGTAAVRKSADYLPFMIRLGGGRYVFEGLGDGEQGGSGVDMTMEEFYAAARDADYLIYNASIDDPLHSVDDLLAKSELFANFKAVREGNVWSTGKYLFQATDILGNFVWDVHLMLSGETDPDAFTFIHPLN